MISVIKNDSENIPIKLWVTDLEQSALSQARNLSNLPFAFRHIALMPDCHMGYGMPIGGVLATKNVIIPNAVGVDIGCGVSACKTTLRDIDMDTLKGVMSEIRKCIPLGMKRHKAPQTWVGFDKAPVTSIIQQELNRSRHQLGTLGGGNHFIEIQKGSDGFIWVMLHSGSRNFGYKIANEYHEKAKAHCLKWYSSIPNQDLSFLPVDSRDGSDYLLSMNFALEFAKENRNQMMRTIQQIFSDMLRVEFNNKIDIHHNYASIENHFDRNVMVHRKGATLARKGTVGLIPGSQGTKSYLVHGKGNPESFMSCSHGAGRTMGRKQAQRELDLEVEIQRLDEQGIIHAIRGTKDLDEAPGAYKDIVQVMANQDDLVDIVTEFSPLAVVKA